jgi:hypothetical protein
MCMRNLVVTVFSFAIVRTEVLIVVKIMIALFWDVCGAIRKVDQKYL